MNICILIKSYTFSLSRSMQASARLLPDQDTVRTLILQANRLSVVTVLHHLKRKIHDLIRGFSYG